MIIRAMSIVARVDAGDYPLPADLEERRQDALALATAGPRLQTAWESFVSNDETAERALHNREAVERIKELGADGYVLWQREQQARLAAQAETLDVTPVVAEGT